ncbi:MAG: YggS family pyridoxal phosphate-dependent enzyme [Rhodospirillaceae bacterium]
MSVPSSSLSVSDIAENICALRYRIAQAAKRVDRSPEAVSLVAVSKKQSEGLVRAALEAGQRVFAENRVQEAQAKWPHLKAQYPDIELHLIGPLQTNKVQDAVALFDVIETVDRPKLAIKLANEMAKQGRYLPCFIQVNTGEEDQKAGITPVNTTDFVTECQTQHGLHIAGLMCIPPQDEEPALHFAFLRELAQRTSLAGLSMGMSADFETAVEMGATHVRLGSAVFGERN